MGRLGVAQLVARSVRDAEVACSSQVTQTIYVFRMSLEQAERPKGQTPVQVRSPRPFKIFGVWRSGSAHAWGA